MAGWKYGLCGCFSNCGLAVTSFFCPCVVFGRVAEAVGEPCGKCGCCLLVPGLHAYVFKQIRHKFRISMEIEGTPCNDILMGLFCTYCATVQMAAFLLDTTEVSHQSPCQVKVSRETFHVNCLTMSIDSAIVMGVRDLWEKGHLQDFIIQVEDRSFKVHKLIMASVSNYICSKLIGTKGKRAINAIRLEGVRAKIVENLIRFIYKGEIGLTEKNVSDIIDGAVLLQIPTAVKVCAEYMMNHLTDYHHMLALFRKYGLTKEIQRVKDLITESHGERFNAGSMTYEDICYNIDTWPWNEGWLFDEVLQWVEADKPNRRQHLNDLASRVRFCLMTQEELRKIQEMDIYKECFEWWHVLVTKAIEYHKLPVHQKVLNDSEQNTVRGLPSPSAITDDGQSLYSLKDDKWWRQELKEHLESQQLTAIVVNNFIIVKACDEKAPEWSVFDPRMQSWSQLASSVKRKSKHFVLVHHSNHLYVVAGCQESTSIPDYHYSTDTVEKYDFRTNEWSSYLELVESLMCHAACIFEASLYISGGHVRKDEESFSEVCCYHLASTKWKRVPPLLEPMSDHVMTVMRLTGEEVLTVLSADFQLSYLCSGLHEWTKFTISPNLKLLDPKLSAWHKLVFSGLPEIPTGNVVVNGNSVFFSDAKKDGQWRNGGICFVLAFAEKGQGATVKYLPSLETDLVPLMLSVSRDHFPLCLI